MIQFNTVEPLKLYTTPLVLPTDEVQKTKGYMIYTLNTTLESIANILANQQPMVKNQANSYKSYYYDYKTLRQGSLQTKRFKRSTKSTKDFRTQRVNDYNYIRSIKGDIKTPLEISTFTGLNILYDLQPLINVMQEATYIINRMTFVERIKFFFSTIHTELQKEVSVDGVGNYNKSAVLINLDDYHQQKKDGYQMYIDYLLLVLDHKPTLISEINANAIPIIFFSTKGFFKVEPQNIVKNSSNVIKRFIKKLSDDTIEPENAINSIISDMIKTELNTKMNLLGDDELTSDSPLVTDIISKLKDPEEIEDAELAELIGDDEDLKQSLIASAGVISAKKAKGSKRDEELRKSQMLIKMQGRTIQEILDDTKIPSIETTKIENTPCLNPNMKTYTFSNFDKTYLSQQYNADIVKVLSSLNDKTINCNILSIDVVDTSNELTLKETYTISYEDELRKRHTIKVSLPKFIDDQFIYVNGNKKIINKQIFAKPVVKTGPDEVQICTNYNKIFIRRFGTKYNPNMEKFRKIMLDPLKYNITYTKGDNSKINADYLVGLEYSEISTRYSTIDIGKAHFVFNADELYHIFNGMEESTLDKQLVGYEGSIKSPKPIFYDKHNSDNIDLVSIMMSYASDEVKADFSKFTTGKKYMHTKATIMAKNIPVVVLISFFEGLSSVMRKFGSSNVSYSDKKDRGDNYMYIKFADGFLCYPFSDTEACNLFNGFTELDTKMYTLAEMDNRETYLDIFDRLLGTSYISGALINYYDFMIDPITLEILNKLNYPTDLVSLIIFANNLLSDNEYFDDIDFNLYRLRGPEIIPALLYKEISKSYARYRATANNPNPIRMSMDENAVIKELIMLPTVEDYSTLNPAVEISKTRLASMKGYVGMNLDRAYTQDKRSYHDTMLGIVGISTDPGPNCGKIRQLTLEPKVTNVRGFFDINTNPQELKDVNLFTPVELSTPSSTTRDDPNRVAMTTKQTGHIISVANPAPVFITNGMDQMIHYHTSNDFSIVAEEDGKIVERDDKLGIVIVEYKSGKHRAIDINPKVVKNGGGGFYLSNKLKVDLPVGKSFKKDEIIAYEEKFFKNQKQFGTRMVMGSVQKTAVASSFATFEDSGIVTKKMSRDMASDIVMNKTIIVGKNATVDFIVKKGQPIKIGDNLIKFENSFDDSDLNKMLSSIRDDLKEEIINLGKTNIKSKYDGVIEDVIIYCACDTEDLSPSLKKIVSAYYKTNKDRVALLDKYDKDNKKSVYRMGMMLDKPIDKTDTQYGKIKGQQVDDGVMIEFYIKKHDELAVGDKITMFTAMKNTIGYVIPEGYEPYTAFRPYEEVSTFLAPSAIIQRNTPSVLYTALGNKNLIELKRKLYEILTGENYNALMKREAELKNVKESVEFTDDDILMESIIDITRTPEGYTSNRVYNNGDVIMPFRVNSNIVKHMDYSHMKTNACISEGFIYATELIEVGDTIILAPTF